MLNTPLPAEIRRGCFEFGDQGSVSRARIHESLVVGDLVVVIRVHKRLRGEE